MADELERAGSANDVCRALVESALHRGGRDNVTTVVASYRRPAAPGTPPAR
jgi:serine/threonine protein phosphatase PrpC